MDYLLLPDFFAMLLLVTVLLAMRSKEGRDSIKLWVAGLLLILVECAARLVYDTRLPLPWHQLMHVIALDAYLLAGVMFLRSASHHLRRLPHMREFLWCNVTPHLALLTLYGSDNRNPRLYHGVVLLGLAVGVASCALLRRRPIYYAAFAALWMPLMICTTIRDYRTAIYITLFFLYLLVAFAFYLSLPRGSRGKIAVVAGFTVWSLCFLTHPAIAEHHKSWTAFAGAVWNMQKFVITVGLLVVMLEQQLRNNQWLALHDELTDLPNRRLFDDRLTLALARAERDGERIALFTLDLNGFKQVNDTLGHDAGDVLLRVVGREMNDAIRKTDTLARMGGDEFSLLATDLGDAPEGEYDMEPKDFPQTARIQRALLKAVEKPITVVAGKPPVHVSASIGVAVYPDDGVDAKTLQRIADQRMYSDKKLRAARRALLTEDSLALSAA